MHVDKRIKERLPKRDIDVIKSQILGNIEQGWGANA
jgi:hypothetical protein